MENEGKIPKKQMPLMFELIKYKGNWPEDYDLENGYYFNICLMCKNWFIGYKRRVVCKLCQNK